MPDVLKRVLNIGRDEIAPTIVAILYFFLILFGYFLIRPVREALGVERSWTDMHWLFGATAVVMLLVNPLYGLLASRLPRAVFVPLVYAFFLLNLLGFYVVLTISPRAIGLATGYAFYVWLSVFNLFATSIFWQVMSDSFTLEQSQRIFPMVAVGGTLGALAGSTFAWQLAETIGAATMMPIAAGVIALGVLCAVILMRIAPPTSEARAAPADTFRAALRGVSLVSRSPYLLGVGGYIFILAVAATFLYFAQARIVSAAAEATDERTSLFAMIDMLAQGVTLLLQLLVVGRLMRRVGTGLTLAILPVLGVGLLVGVAIWPTLLAITIAQAAFRAGKHAIARPARETLFTVLGREEKYEAKAVVDTFVYRAGDVAGAGVSALMTALGPGLAAIAALMLPVGALWASLGILLGRLQRAPRPLACARCAYEITGLPARDGVVVCPECAEPNRLPAT